MNMKFYIGQTVRLSQKGIETGIKGKSTSPYGVITGLGRTKLSIWVLRDGLKNPDDFHVDFWEPAKEINGTSVGRSMNVSATYKLLRTILSLDKEQGLSPNGMRTLQSFARRALNL
jgi:hypothetical protein